ncbi:MAG TPA: hypothetical protein PKI03_38445, partial [Pseudomonadota bacterium]|nr:hypothetical protein [Pseudomonadota bacterium]
MEKRTERQLDIRVVRAPIFDSEERIELLQPGAPSHTPRKVRCSLVIHVKGERIDWRTLARLDLVIQTVSKKIVRLLHKSCGSRCLIALWEQRLDNGKSRPDVSQDLRPVLPVGKELA